MFSMPGTTEMLVIGGMGLLIFGKRLPGVARAIGSTFVEFKKGLGGVTEEIESVQKGIKEIKQDTKKALEDKK